MTMRRQDIDEEADHWRQYERQQQEAAARIAGTWDHAGEAPPATWRALLAAIAYAAAAVSATLLIVGYGFLA